MNTITTTTKRIPYNRYLVSPEWFALRQAKFSESGRVCSNCGGTGILHVHHIRYSPNREDTQLSDLMVLCEGCHSDIHKAIKLIGIRRHSVGPDNVRQVMQQYKEMGGDKAYKAFREKKRLERRAKGIIIPQQPPKFKNKVKKLIHPSPKGGYTLEAVKKLIADLTDLITKEEAGLPLA